MILCIDSGNSRIKWGVRAQGAWRATGATGHDDLAPLQALTVNQPPPEKIILANVAGPAAEAAIRAALAAWGTTVDLARSTESAAGVTSHYHFPERLGVDRWCALIGARSLYPGEALLVVMAGTATTIDSLAADGSFLGGLILPGQRLMLGALARDTAGLPFADGQHAPWPRCTEDAIVSGAIEAQAGAIERAWGRLGGAKKRCLLSGGNADVLAPHLAVPRARVENLPLLGLARLAGDS